MKAHILIKEDGLYYVKDWPDNHTNWEHGVIDTVKAYESAREKALLSSVKIAEECVDMVMELVKPGYTKFYKETNIGGVYEIEFDGEIKIVEDMQSEYPGDYIAYFIPSTLPGTAGHGIPEPREACPNCKNVFPYYCSEHGKGEQDAGEKDQAGNYLKLYGHYYKVQSFDGSWQIFNPVNVMRVGISPPTDRQEEWISVKDKLPELDTPVLIYNERINLFEVSSLNNITNSSYEEIGDNLFKRTINPFQCWDNNDATHWMPLPEPPRKVNN